MNVLGSDTISLSPTIDMLAPYVMDLTSAILAVVVPVAVAKFYKWTGVQENKSAEDTITKAAQTQAGLIGAAITSSLAKTSITVDHPLVANAVNWIQKTEGPALKTLGITPENAAAYLAPKIAGAIGHLPGQVDPGIVAPPGKALS